MVASRDEIELSESMTLDADWAGDDCMYAMPAATAPAATAAVPTVFMAEDWGNWSYGHES